MHLRLVPPPSSPPQHFARGGLLLECRARVEKAARRGFRDDSLVNLRSDVRRLPLLVQCALRVHDRREPPGALILGVDPPEARERTQWRSVIVAPSQRVVLLFSPSGTLDAAGTLLSAGEPRIAWASDLGRHDWY